MADKNAPNTIAPAAAAPATSEKKGMSDATKAKLAKRTADRKTAKVAILEYLKQFDLTKPDEKLLNDQIMLFVGATQRTGGGSKGPALSPTGALKDFLVANPKGVSEMDIYKKFHIGRPEMIIKMRVLIQRAKTPADRVWVKFVEGKSTDDDGMYVVAGTRANAPKDWDGYVPETSTGEETL